MDKSPSRNLELIKAQVSIAKKTKRLIEQHNFKPTWEKKVNSSKLYDRLYKEHLKKAEQIEVKREYLKSEQNRKSMEGCTFQPTIS